ncbi:MAG: hypothetical protein ACKOTB_13980 [Planctomycetia bacterium]
MAFDSLRHCDRNPRAAPGPFATAMMNSSATRVTGSIPSKFTNCTSSLGR